ncbi:unnamed protein product [Alopecurus aequalis]
MAAREDDAASKRTAEAADHKGDETVDRTTEDQKADETVARTAADVNECSDDEDPVIRNLNLMSRLNLMTPEWIENRKKRHYETIALHNWVYDALEKGDFETNSDEEAVDAIGRGIWASVDLSGLNTVGGESCGMDAVAVYPAGVYPRESHPEEEDHIAATAADEESSS